MFFPNRYTFSIVSENKVLKYLNSQGINKATGLDGIPSRFVRDGASIIACPLTHVIYLSLIQGVVPDDLKSARVVPLFRKSDKSAKFIPCEHANTNMTGTRILCPIYTDN